MDYTFHPAAEAELNDAIDYYESIQPGIDLAEEVQRGIGGLMRLLPAVLAAHPDLALIREVFMKKMAASVHTKLMKVNS